MCRLSDLASQATHLKQDGSHEQLCLRRSQITFHSYRMMITLAGTKNDASRDGFVIPAFSCPGTNLDPVTALRAWNTQQQYFPDCSHPLILPLKSRPRPLSVSAVTESVECIARIKYRA